jgi:hypothetical protein
MVVVSDRFHIHDHRGKTVHAECRGGQEGPFDAMGDAIPQNPPGRTARRTSRFLVVIQPFIEELLNFLRPGESAKKCQLLAAESKIILHARQNSRKNEFCNTLDPANPL